MPTWVFCPAPSSSYGYSEDLTLQQKNKKGRHHLTNKSNQHQEQKTVWREESNYGDFNVLTFALECLLELFIFCVFLSFFDLWIREKVSSEWNAQARRCGSGWAVWSPLYFCLHRTDIYFWATTAYLQRVSITYMLNERNNGCDCLKHTNKRFYQLHPGGATGNMLT